MDSGKIKEKKINLFFFENFMTADFTRSGPFRGTFLNPIPTFFSFIAK